MRQFFALISSAEQSEQLLGQIFFISWFTLKNSDLWSGDELYIFYTSITNSKTSKVDLQSVLNIYIFYHFP